MATRVFHIYIALVATRAMFWSTPAPWWHDLVSVLLLVGVAWSWSFEEPRS